MTVKLLAAWNGNSPGIVTLDGTTEARLIAQGLATADVDYQAAEDGEFLRGVRNPLTGGIKKLLVAGGVAPVAISLAKSGVPVILAPNGTVATNGTITLSTALPTTYTGGAWVYLPAGAVVGGSAGLFWVVFSSPTVGDVKTLFANPNQAFTPYVPTGALVSATGSNTAYVQSVGADITLVNVSLPASMLGKNGRIDYTVCCGWNSSAGVKGPLRAMLGGTNIGNSATGTTTASLRATGEFANAGAENINKAPPVGSSFGTAFGGSPSSVSNGYFSIDTTTTQEFKLTGTVAVATDLFILESFIVVVSPS